ncbi:MAG: heme-binding domain-containing protein [Chloroflexi bacterium]|nr:heme-binding domain-containing protein [Chloroflexota bacterium]
MLKKIIGIGLLAAIVLFGLIQLVPYGKDHTNPPVVAEPKWDSPATRDLAKRACFDCHSSEVVWPWYSNVAPVSWLVQHDVDEARYRVNFSEWQTGVIRPQQAATQVQRGNMPPKQYLLMHPTARLTAAESEQLAQGLLKSLQ